ncbi:MAG: AraC family transcriptional regulator, partial [Comamonadaceae bacterium]
VNILREQLGRPATASAGWLRGLGDPAIAKAIQCIHAAPADNWTVEQLAQASGMSRSRFAERFKECVGSSPIGYLTEHRMALAAEHLEAGQLPTSRIADQAGYESPRVFARAFQRWAGVTPSAFVQQERERRRVLFEWDRLQQSKPGD